MQENILKIYKNNIELIDLSDQAIINFRRLNYDQALRITTCLLVKLEETINFLFEAKEYFSSIFDMEWISGVLNNILDSQKQQDYILLADLLEGQLVPMIEQYQSCIISERSIDIDYDSFNRNRDKLINEDKTLNTKILAIENIIDNGYQIEYTASGLYTVACNSENQCKYIHSNNHPMKEAFSIADSWYSEEKITYVIFGIGLGYHISSLAKIDDNIKIEVYEQDVNMLALCCGFGEAETLLNNQNITIIYDPSCIKLYTRISKIQEHEEFVVHAPSIALLKDKQNREKLENYFLQYSSYKNQLILLRGNFRSNINHFDYIIDDFKGKFVDKDLYIIAAGPSLDKNFRKLINRSKDSIILATGTVFNKLIQAGIQPDYVIVTDANPRVIGQIAGNEENDAKLIILSTAYKEFALKYRGEKIIVFQKNFDLSEEYVKQKNYHLFQTGGSVSTLALDIGIELKCKRIICLGLDLGYTDNFVHAENTSRRTLSDKNHLRQIKDVNGKLIYTSKSLDTYRVWIEKRIKDVQDIDIIDATEGGAYIKGMKIMTLDEAMSNR